MKNVHNTLSSLSAGVIADIKAKVKIGKIFGGYFNSLQNAKTFTNVGLSDFAASLPEHLRFADFGGGDGFLTAEVKHFLEKHKKKVEGVVVDGNPYSLQEAANKGFITLEAALEDTKLKNFDLIIMRAVLHYNTKTIQKKILQKVKTALTPNGIFIHQLSSGDSYNVRLRNALSQLPSLERIQESGSIHFMTVQEYLDLCNELDFPTKFLGYAPEDAWTLEEMYDRFHPEIKTMTQEQIENDEKRNIFLKEATELVHHYKETTPIEGIEEKNGKIRIWRTYPIFISQHSSFA